MKFAEWFDFAGRETNLKTEVLAGVTTFLTMVYIVIVNPSILSRAGMDFGGAYVATIVASAVGMLLMGVTANYPIAMAPGLGMSAYFSYAVILSGGTPWQDALGAAFAASLLFVVLSLTRLLPAFIDAIPENLRIGITAGIGFFISFIGLENGKLIIGSPTTLTTLGNFSEPVAFLTLIGFFVMAVLLANHVKGAIFIGMVVVGIIAYIQGFLALPAAPFSLPEGLDKTFLQMDLSHLAFLPVITFTLLLVAIFDMMGTMIGVGMQAGLVKNGHFPNLKKAMLSDSIGSLVGALFGTAPLSCYVESTTGVAAGGRTGMVAVVVAGLFGLMLFCMPLAKAFADLSAISAPALILVGFLMMENVCKIAWKDITEGLPVFVMMMGMPLSYSITTGVGAGFIVYVLLKLCTGQRKAVHPLVYAFSAVFLFQFAFLM